MLHPVSLCCGVKRAGAPLSCLPISHFRVILDYLDEWGVCGAWLPFSCRPNILVN